MRSLASLALTSLMLIGCTTTPIILPGSPPQAKICAVETPLKGSTLPTSGTMQYGASRTTEHHTGIDFIIKTREPVRAVRGGKRDLVADGGQEEWGGCAGVYDESAHTSDLYCGIGEFRHIAVTAEVKAGDILGWPLQRPDGTYIIHFEVQKWDENKNDMLDIDPTTIVRQANNCK